MKNTISFLFILLVFKLQMPETLDATLAELNFMDDRHITSSPLNAVFILLQLMGTIMNILKEHSNGTPALKRNG
jgi:uncharacterized membrane protein (DUF373 family)